MLLQGPPGTGKTRTVLGIVSALLGTQSDEIGGANRGAGYGANIGANIGARSATAAAAASQTPGYVPPHSTNSWAHLRRSGLGARRLLICAPSNGAVSEIVLRLLRDGVNGPNGEPPSAPRVIRLGSAEPEAHPLVQQAVWDTQVDARLSQSPTVKALADIESEIQGLRFVVGEYTATTPYCFLLLLASPARVQTL